MIFEDEREKGRKRSKDEMGGKAVKRRVVWGGGGANKKSHFTWSSERDEIEC